MMGALTATNIEAGYGGLSIIRGISLTLPEGKLHGLVGPNGHGKTTLLRALTGVIPTRRGSIALGDRVLTGLPADRIVRSGVTHIPQGDMLFTEMTVLENLQMGGYSRTPAERTGLMEFVFDLFPRLRERAGQTASTLSGGERRMLAIGRGLMTGGRVILIDEPSLGLSPLVTDQIYEVFINLKREGLSLLIVEENASRLVGIADRISLLDHGEFVWEGEGAELERRPELLATYLGA